jgi:hypothetical protein
MENISIYEGGKLRDVEVETTPVFSSDETGKDIKTDFEDRTLVLDSGERLDLPIWFPTKLRESDEWDAFYSRLDEIETALKMIGKAPAYWSVPRNVLECLLSLEAPLKNAIEVLTILDRTAALELKRPRLT